MSIQELKKKEREQRRNYIINVAQELFLNEDYDSVSMNSIAKEVGVNKATLYNYFKNKEALFFAVLLRGVKILVKIVKEELEKEATGFEKLTLVGEAHSRFYKEYPGCLELLYASQSNKFDLDNLNSSEEFKEVTKLLKELILITSDSIQSGINDGTIRQDVNPVEAAVLISLIAQSTSNMGCVHMEVLESNRIDRQRFTMDVRGFIHYMLKNNEN